MVKCKSADLSSADRAFRVDAMSKCMLNPERVFFRLMNPNNETIHPGAFVLPFQGMALTFHYYLGERPEGSASFPLTEQLACMAAPGPEELLEAAMENTPVLFPPKLEPLHRMCMQQVIREADQMEAEEVVRLLDGDVGGAYVVTNESMAAGAAAVLYPGILKSLAEHLEDDLYLIPSSVHEMIVVPARMFSGREEIDRMLQSVNTMTVPEKEVLSEHCLHYCREDGHFD